MELDAKVCHVNARNRHDLVGFDLLYVNIVNNPLPSRVTVGQVVQNLVYHPLGCGLSGFEFVDRDVLHLMTKGSVCAKSTPKHPLMICCTVNDKRFGLCRIYPPKQPLMVLPCRTFFV